MKVLFVLPEFPPQYGGGIATYYGTLVPAVAAQGHEVDVLVGSAFTEDRPPQQEEGYRVEFLDVDRRRKAIQEFTAYEAIPPLRRTLAAAWALFQQAGAATEYDVVETTDFGLSFLPWVTSDQTPPILVQLHASNGQLDALVPKEGNALKGHLTRLLEIQGLSQADALQTLAQTNAQSWSERLGREVTYCPPPLRSEPGSDLQRPKVDTEAEGFVAGRIQHPKGPTVLCEAQAQLGDRAPCIDWAGRDTDYQAVGQSMDDYLAEAYPDVWRKSVRPIGQIPPEKVARRQSAAQFVVVPSIWDVFNYTVVEALREGTVTICSDGAGAADLIEDGQNGFVVPAKDEEALAEAIQTVRALSQDERIEIGRAGRETVRQALSPERIAKRRIDAYEDLDRQNNKTVLDRTWLKEAMRPGGEFESQHKKKMAFLDQHSIRIIGRYLIRRIWSRIFEFL